MLPRGSVATASVREITRRTLLPRGSVCRALGRLIEDGRIIKLLGPKRSLNAANRYRLLDPAVGSSPLWSNSGLGVTSGPIYEALSPDYGMTVTEVASQVGCSQRTVRNQLFKLLSAGLIDRNEQRKCIKFDDSYYLIWYTEWLCGDALKAMSRKIDQEQFAWNALVGPRIRGAL
jgi:DNA-binding MarR family transcriptional regulator